MGVHIALLRGVNVGGANRLAMADLKTLATREGFGRPRTLLQSGNLLFDADATVDGDLERKLEASISRHLGLTVDVVVRTAGEWRAVVAANPFPGEARDDPGHLLVVCLKSDPVESAGARLNAAIVGPEVAHVIGRAAFIHYPAGAGASRLTPAVIDRALGTRGTARNWNTVLKIAAMFAG
jgi:uncharacterized protein (DUF1697 family)